MTTWAIWSGPELLDFPVCADCLLEAIREHRGKSRPGEPEVTASRIVLTAHRRSEAYSRCEQEVAPAPVVPAPPGPDHHCGNLWDDITP